MGRRSLRAHGRRRAGCSSSVAVRPVSRRRGSAPSAATTSCSWRRPTSSAGNGASPAGSRHGHRCSTTSPGTPPSSNASASTSGAGGWSTAADVAAEAADHVVVAVGAVPPAAGFQRALRLADRLPGVELGRATTAQDVLAGDRRRGGSRAAARRRRRLAGDRHGDVSSRSEAAASPSPPPRAAVAGAPVPQRRRRPDPPPLRPRRWRAGAEHRRHPMVRGRRDAALDAHGSRDAAGFDWLVVAGTPVARAELSAELEGLGIVTTSIGDCLAPRTAAAAILDGRRVALAT